MIDPSGLEGDRILALCDQHGELITGRTESRLIPLKSALNDSELIVWHAGKEHRFALNRTAEIANKHFSYRFQSSKISEEADAWFSALLERPCHLIAQSKEQPRGIKEEFGSSKLHMADAGPLLLLNRSSLHSFTHLNQEEKHELRFRPNLVVESGKAFEEHEWERIQIGSVSLRRMKDCGRCVFTTKDPFTGEMHPNSEPLRSLSKTRVDEKGEAIMGVYFIPEQCGEIKLSDPLSVLNTREHIQ